jgi:hypothetical protein
MIRGFFDPSYQPPLATILIGLVLPHRAPTYVPVEFIIDTGASDTCLHPSDALDRLRFSDPELAGLPRIARANRVLAGITGTAVYFAVPARYILAQDDGTPRVIDGEIQIAQPTSGNRLLPSVLGWDLLQHFRITLDRRTGEVLLQ